MALVKALVNYPEGIQVWGMSVEFGDEKFIKDWTPHAFQMYLQENYRVESKMAIGICLLYHELNAWEARKTGYDVPYSYQECLDKLTSLKIKVLEVVIGPL